MAAVHVALDNKDEAFRQLDRAMDRGDDWGAYLKVEPRFTPLRDDPRFLALARRLGF